MNAVAQDKNLEKAFIFISLCFEECGNKATLKRYKQTNNNNKTAAKWNGKRTTE